MNQSQLVMEFTYPAIGNPKTCPGCKQPKHRSQFGVNNQTKDKLNVYCKPCICRKSAVSYKKNHETALQQRRNYAAKHREKAKEYHSRWYNANKARRTRQIKRYRAKRPEWAKSYVKAWEKANPEKRSLYAKRLRFRNPGYNSINRMLYAETLRQVKHRRRAREKNAKIGHVDFRGIMKRDGMVCHICKKPIERDVLHFDHIIPLAKGGEHSMNNIACAHKSCNLRKHTKIL
jgi:hypothetical protein